MGIQPNLGQSPILGLDAEYIVKVKAPRVSLADLKIRVIGSNIGTPYVYTYPYPSQVNSRVNARRDIGDIGR